MSLKDTPKKVAKEVSPPLSINDVMQDQLVEVIFDSIRSVGSILLYRNGVKFDVLETNRESANPSWYTPTLHLGARPAGSSRSFKLYRLGSQRLEDFENDRPIAAEDWDRIVPGLHLVLTNTSERFLAHRTPIRKIIVGRGNIAADRGANIGPEAWVI